MDQAREGERAFLVDCLKEAGACLRSHFGSGLPARQKSDGSLVTDADAACDELLRARIQAAYPDDGLWLEESGKSSQDGPMWIVDPLDGTSNFAHGMPYFGVSVCRVIASGDRYRPVLGGVYAPVMERLFVAERGRGATLNGEPIQVAPPTPLRRAYLATGIYYLPAGDEIEAELERYRCMARACQKIRRHGAGALDLSHVAGGFHHAFWQSHLAPWDIAAGVLLVQEAGGTVQSYTLPNAIMDDFPQGPAPGLVAGHPDMVATLLEPLRSA